MDLMLEVAQYFFRLRAIGQRTGGSSQAGCGAAFGFMRSLALSGPLTVPQIAEMRPTSRQRMQRLADELAAEGLVEFIDNPGIGDRSRPPHPQGRGARPGSRARAPPDDRVDDGRRAERDGHRKATGIGGGQR